MLITEVINVPPEPWLQNSRNLACVSLRKYVKEGNVGRLRARGGHHNRTSVFCWGGKRDSSCFRESELAWISAMLPLLLVHCTASHMRRGVCGGALCACMVYVLCFDGSMVRAELCAQKRREKAFAKVLSNRYDDCILRTTFLYIAVSRVLYSPLAKLRLRSHPQV